MRYVDVFFFFFLFFYFFFQAEDGIRDDLVTGVRRVLFRSLIQVSGLWRKESLTRLRHKLPK